jgi:hypothetical protein
MIRYAQPLAQKTLPAAAELAPTQTEDCQDTVVPEAVRALPEYPRPLLALA